MFLLIKKNRIINLDHVVSAEYTPAASGIDEDDGKPFNNDSRLSITLASTSMEKAEQYDGTAIGCAAVSDIINLRDREADSVWKFFVNPKTERVNA